jgi:drug/metabolite transporter (DMT)-like permease
VVIFKLFLRSHRLATNAVALGAGAAVLLVLSRLAGESCALPSTAATWAAFAYLVLFGSVAVFSLNLYVLSRWTASASSYSYLLMPVMATAIGAWLLREVVTPSFVIGAALGLLGVWIGVIHRSRRAVESASSEMPNRALC